MLKFCYLISHCWRNICSLFHRAYQEKEKRYRGRKGRERERSTITLKAHLPMTHFLQPLKVQLPKTLALTVSQIFKHVSHRVGILCTCYNISESSLDWGQFSQHKLYSEVERDENRIRWSNAERKNVTNWKYYTREIYPSEVKE